MTLTLEGALIRNGSFELRADFSVAAGTRNAVIGPSGAGKSTLLHAVAGFLPLEAGRVAWDGRDLSELTPGRRPLSIVFQDQNLFPHLTVTQNVALGVDPNPRRARAHSADVAAALERVGLAGLGDRKPGRLSGGQQSRVALARVLVRHRPILLLDEPFAALGPALRTEMLDLVGELSHETGATLLMVTHEPRDALRIAPRTVVVANGEAVAPQDTDALLRSPPAALRDYLGPA